MNSWLERTSVFPLLPETLFSTATWWLPKRALLYLVFRCRYNSSDCTVKILEGNIAPLNEMFPELLKPEHIILYDSCPDKCLLFKLCYSTVNCIRIVHL